MSEPMDFRITQRTMEARAMKTTYDMETDTLRIILSAQAIEESDEDKPGVIIDYDAAGNVVGLEILDASKRVEDPRKMEYTITDEAGEFRMCERDIFGQLDDA